MDPEQSRMVGLAGGIAGGVLGAAIGIAGAWFGIRASLKSTRGPRERAFVLQFAIRTGVLTCAFVAGLLLLSGPWRVAVVFLYFTLLLVFIIQANRRQAEIRRSESCALPDQDREQPDASPKS